MRTTIRRDDDFLQRAKTHAARTGQTLTAVIEGARFPSMDLDDSASLLDWMELGETGWFSHTSTSWPTLSRRTRPVTCSFAAGWGVINGSQA